MLFRPDAVQRPGFPFVSVRRNVQRGFSLVEITMAIGIVAFAFVAIFGLVPIGLNTFREAMDTSVRAQIVQRVVFEAQQTDPKTLESRADVLRYFDDEGTEVEPEASIYTTTMALLSETELPETAISQNIMTLTVKVAHNPAHAPNPFGDDSKLHVTTHSAFIARASK